MAEPTKQKPECNVENWHDARHHLGIHVVPLVLNVWPLDNNSVSCAIYCRNGCGLEFAACIVRTVNGLTHKRLDVK